MLDPFYTSNFRRVVCHSNFALHAMEIQGIRRAEVNVYAKMWWFVPCLLYFCQIHKWQFKVTRLFKSRIANYTKTLLLGGWAKIQYTRDDEGPHS